MSATTTAILAAFAVLTVWGAIAPRGQWRVLAGWTRREPHATEPGPISVGVHRAVAILATATLVAGGVLLSLGHDRQASAASPLVESQVTALWGKPDPVVVNRVAYPPITPPDGLLLQPIVKYQAINGPSRDPSYLFSLTLWKPPSTDGLVGADPDPGLSALDTAYVVVQVRANPLCIPRQIVTVQGDTTVAIAVYYGRPGATASLTPGDCAVGPNDQAVSALIPIPLEVALNKRKVTTLEGIPVASAAGAAAATK